MLRIDLQRQRLLRSPPQWQKVWYSKPLTVALQQRQVLLPQPPQPCLLRGLSQWQLQQVLWLYLLRSALRQQHSLRDPAPRQKVLMLQLLRAAPQHLFLPRGSPQWQKVLW